MYVYMYICVQITAWRHTVWLFIELWIMERRGVHYSHDQRIQCMHADTMYMVLVLSVWYRKPKLYCTLLYTTTYTASWNASELSALISTGFVMVQIWWQDMISCRVPVATPQLSLRVVPHRDSVMSVAFDQTWCFHHNAFFERFLAPWRWH